MKIESALQRGFEPLTITIENTSELMLLLRVYGKMGSQFDAYYPDSSSVFEILLKEASKRGIDYKDYTNYPAIIIELDV